MRLLRGGDVGQEDFCGAGFGQYIQNAGVFGVREALRGEDYRAVGLTHDLQPFAYFLPEYRVAEHDPGFIQHKDGRRSVQ